MTNYARANTTAQWFQDNYPGAVIDPNVGVLHTTEGTSWPSYSGGATAPNYTARPNMTRKRLEWRAHFPDERSSRALRNEAGGVETNTLNALQVELVGTCDSTKRVRWNGLRAGVHYIYWPEAPEWALRDLAAFVADVHRRHGIPLKAPTFKQYPSSYGANGVRFSGTAWRKFVGWCGHQHVPENSHGDPGDLDIDAVFRFASELIDPEPEVLVRHRVATYNVGHRRNPNKVRAEVARLAKGHDVLLLQEAQEYHPELRSIEGFRLRGLGENVILVRDGLKVSNTRTVQVTSAGWVTKKGKLTKPERTTYANVDGIEYSSWHFPPSVQSRFQRTRMARRWGAYRDMGSHFKLAERAVAGGDFNVHAGSDKGRVYAFPKAMIARAKARRVRSHAPTHGRREIDYFAVRGVRTATARVLRGYDSDHKPVSVTVSFRKDR